MYRKIGGHSFPWVYSGPIGAIITPQFMSVRHKPGLPFASSLCGACAEVCPVKIDIPKILLDLREDVVKARTEDASNQLERLAFKMFAFAMSHPWVYRLAGKMAAMFAAREAVGTACAGLEMLPPVKSWLSQRDLPSPAKKSFRDLVEGAERLMKRDLILRDVRNALGRHAGQAVPPPPPARIVIPDVPVSQRIDSMLERVAALAGKTLRAKSMAEAREYVAAVIEGKTAVASNAPFLRDCGITELPGVRSGITDREELRGLCATCNYGITSADFGLSDTGSLVMISSREEAQTGVAAAAGPHRGRARIEAADGFG